MTTREIKAALVLLAALLAGCGGGGNSETPAETAAETPLPPPRYFKAGTASASPLTQELVVFDPSKPSIPRFRLDITDKGGNSTYWVPSMAVEVDQENRRVTTLGTAWAFFLQGGRVYGLDLEISRAANPVQLSSVTNACRIFTTFPMNAAGSDVWLAVATAGPDGACDYVNDPLVMVRSTMNSMAGAEPAPMTTSSSMFVLPDETGRALGLVANTASGLRFYDTDLRAGAVVSNGAGVRALADSGHFPAARKLFLRTADGDGVSGLRELTYTNTAASLSGNLLTFDTTHLDSADRADWETYYFAHEHRIYKLTTEGPSLFASLAGGRVSSITPTRHYVVAQTQDPVNYARTTWSIPQAGGQPTNLQTPGVSYSNAQYNYPGVVSGDTVYFYAGDGKGLGAIYSVDASGQNGMRTVAAPALYAESLAPRTRGVQRPWLAASALVYCVPLAGQTDCSGGTLKQLHLDTSQVTTLGSLPQARSRVPFQIDSAGRTDDWFTVTVRHDFRDRTPSVQDVFVATAGMGNSLKAVTAYYAQ